MSYIVDLYPCVDAMDSDAKWIKMADRTKRSEEKKKQKKEKRKVKGKRQERQRRKRRKRRRRNWNRRRGPWLALSVDECLELPLALLHYLPVYRLGLILVWNFETFPCFQDSQALYTIIYNHCTVCTTSLANLWQVEFLQGEWEHSKRGIGTGNIRHASHASHVGHVFHVMIFVASFRDGKNTENAWERLFGDESHSRIFTVHKKRVSPGPLVAGFQPHGKLVNSAVSKTHGTSVLFLEMENRWKYARHGSVAPKMAEKWCRCWQHEPPRFKDGFKMKIKVQNDGLEPGNRGEGWCSPALATFQISSNEMKSFSKWSGI